MVVCGRVEEKRIESASAAFTNNNDFFFPPCWLKGGFAFLLTIPLKTFMAKRLVLVILSSSFMGSEESILWTAH